MKQPPQSAVDALARFGATIDGKPRWRLIWSEDKLMIGDGQQIREYDYLEHPGWVLEKWFDQTIPREQWDMTRDPETGEFILGPYEAGAYVFCYCFPLDFDAASVLVEKMVELVQAGVERFSFSQRRAACQDRLDKARKAYESRNSDIWDDAQDAFKGLAFSGAHGHRVRGPEDIKVDLTTADLPSELRQRKGGFSQF